MRLPSYTPTSVNIAHLTGDLLSRKRAVLEAGEVRAR